MIFTAKGSLGAAVLSLFVTVPLTGASAKELTADEIRDRLTVTAEVFVFDSSGERLLDQMAERSVIKFAPDTKARALSDRWASRSSAFPGLLAMKSVWEVSDDGEIKVTLTEYTSGNKEPVEGENRYAKVLKSESRKVELMGSVNWISVNDHDDRRVVVRYVPSLREDLPEDVTVAKIAGDDIAIVDNQGTLWADHLGLSGKYVGVTTHRGTLLVSYHRFAGASAIGYAAGKRMELGIEGGLHVTLIAKENFLPGDTTGRVYGIYLPERKSEGLHSKHVNASNQEDEFLKNYR